MENTLPIHGWLYVDKEQTIVYTRQSIWRQGSKHWCRCMRAFIQYYFGCGSMCTIAYIWLYVHKQSAPLPIYLAVGAFVMKDPPLPLYIAVCLSVRVHPPLPIYIAVCLSVRKHLPIPIYIAVCLSVREHPLLPIHGCLSLIFSGPPPGAP